MSRHQPLDCPFEKVLLGEWLCPLCGNSTKADKPPRRNCPTLLERKVPAKVVEGLGTNLHNVLQKRFGLDFLEGCNCQQWVEQMNIWGPQGCRENIGRIVAKMLGEAKRRKWQINGRPLLSAAAKVGTILPGGMIFARAWARRLAFEAIELSEEQDR